MEVLQNDNMPTYQILNIIGRGSYGTVLLCKHSSNFICVLKEVNITSTGIQQYKEAENEINVLSKLNHPYVIQFYNSFTANNCLYIVMEYANHGNLAEYMCTRQAYFLPTSDILYIFCQILLGVQHIHQHNIIHRDIKAENILLSGHYNITVKIGDFGISKILGNDKTCTLIGTPYYLAPELCESKPYNTKTDVWALGCLLYEMCTHQRAFDSPTLVGLIQKIIRGKFTPISNTVYDNYMQELIQCMLTTIPENRASIEDLLLKPYLFPMLCSICSHIGPAYKCKY